MNLPERDGDGCLNAFDRWQRVVSMRPLRWKGRYRTGGASADRRNRAFIGCLNKLIKTAGQREHCREMEDFIDQFSSEADETLREHPADRNLNNEFGRRLLAYLSLAYCRPGGFSLALVGRSLNP